MGNVRATLADAQGGRPDRPYETRFAGFQAFSGSIMPAFRGAARNNQPVGPGEVTEAGTAEKTLKEAYSWSME